MNKNHQEVSNMITSALNGESVSIKMPFSNDSNSENKEDAGNSA